MKRLIDFLRGPYSLRRHLFLASWTIIFLGFLTAVLVVLVFVYQTEENVWRSRELDAARNAGRTVGDFITQVQEYTRIIALIEAEMLTVDPQLLVDLLYENDALLELVRVDQNGELVAGVFREDLTQPVLSNLFTTAQASWFIQARQGNFYIGDLQISAEEDPYIILSVPALDGDVIAVRLRMDVLWQVVSTIHFGDSGQIYVINPFGYIISHRDPQVVLDRTDIRHIPEMKALLEDTGSQFQGTYRNFAGHAVIGTSMPIPSTNWIVIAEIDRQEAFATTRSAILLLAVGLLLGGGTVAAALGWLIQVVVINAVSNLRDGAIRIGQGELDVRIPTRRKDEIGQVADAFNQMAAQLQEREAALSQARDEAIAASRFKSRLMANLSHDLMTPLNGILGYAEMLDEGIYGPLSEKQSVIVRRVFANAQRLISLIRDLLDQAQIEAGKLELTIAPFDPQELLESINAVMGALALRKNIALQISVAPDVPDELLGDFTRLQQILMNLVGNAIKFTDHGKIDVHIFLEQVPGTWCMQVADTGRGIPEDAQAVIFEAFRRVDQTTTRDTAGVGLGLSIVQQLVAAMDGHIDLESELGVGSIFKVLLPIKSAGDS